MPRREPPRQPPPVQRLRLRYSKLGVARFASHRDFARAFERALRRAGVPMAYSSGFSPHPRISYANAAPTSAESHAEYLEISLAEHCDPSGLADRLNAVLPGGFRVLEAVERRGPSLTEVLQASRWRIRFGAPDEAELRDAVCALADAPHVEVCRHVHKGDRVFDVRPAILRVEVESPESLLVALAHTTPLVRPDDVVAALRVLRPRVAGNHPGLFTRLCQGPLMPDGEIGDPLAGQRGTPLPEGR